MKESKYNLYVLNEKEEGVIYNIMYRTTVQIDNEVYNLIKNNKIDLIDEDILEVLKAGGIIVDDAMNELDMVRIKFNKRKYNGTSVKFTIFPSYECNLACTYCYQGHGDILHNTMDKETVQRTIRFIKNNASSCRFMGINFFGGEPFFFPDIASKILKEVKYFADNANIKCSIIFTSNGTLITEEILEKLKNYDYSVQITLAGSKKVHDTIRIDKQGNGTYEKIMKSMNLLKTHDIPIFISVNVDYGNYNSIGALLKDLEERGFGGSNVAFFPIKDVSYAEIERDIKEIDGASLTQLSKMAKDMGFRSEPLMAYNYAERCSSRLDNHFVVNPLGDIYKCFSAVYYDEHKIGSIDENGSLTNINYEAYCAWTLQNPLQNEKCVKCMFVPICSGGCAMMAYGKHGSLSAPSCERKNIESVLRAVIMMEYPELFKDAP
jgi:uncharacterized protein